MSASYTDILVHLDYTKSNPERVKAAISLARRTGARVKGVSIALQSNTSSYLGIPLHSGLSEEEKKQIEEAAQDAVREFETHAKEAGVDHISQVLRCGASHAPAQLAFQARHVDISIMGQPNPDKESASFIESLYEGVLFNSGRPVYLVPYFGRINTESRNAVIAWDGGKKAARAVRDAIPLLRGRGKTTILVINPENRPGAHSTKPGQELAEFLKRHEVDVTVDSFTNHELSPDTLILNHLTDKGADLLVMGAYGHSKLREKAFGGVTNSIVNQMTTPVLMSD